MAAFDEYAYLEQQVEKATAKEKEKEKEPESAGKESGGKESGSRRDSRSGKSRERSRSRDRKERRRDDDRRRSSSRRRSRSRDRERDRDRRRRSRSRDRDRRRSSRDGHRDAIKLSRREPTPPEVREQRERERELAALDRDIRTIFAYNLPLKAGEKELFQFFSAAGKIADVRIITDRSTRRSKGFAYIEFANREDIVKAMGLTGQLLMGQAVMVKSSEAEKNLAWEAAQAQAASAAALGPPGGGGPCRLIVSNLHPNIAESDLRQIFEPFGPVEAVSVSREAGPRGPQSTGTVQYASAADANKAVSQLDRMDIAGQQISLRVAPLAPGEAAAAPQAAQPQADLAEEGGDGMRLSISTRAALMSRLAGAAGGGMVPPQGLPPPPPVPAGPVMSSAAQALALEQGVLGPASPRPTQCLLLKNMFDPAQETEPDWDKEIADDVREECSKHGAVTHVHVDRNSKGFVYLKFESVEGATAAQKALHGRWFAGNQVVAEFQFTAPYVSYFRCG